MILQALVDYYERSDALPREGWIRRPVDYELVLDTGGNCIAFKALGEIRKGKTVAEERLVPAIGKQAMKHTNSGKDANLLWDNKSSVLVGDYLFARSFQLMADTGSMQVMRILANASATIAEGEVLQLTAAQDIATTEDIYIQIVRGKTAALFSAATESGSVVAGADEAVQRALFDYGDALGIAFQIVDDILDYGGTTTTIGKNVGDDFRERKLTLPVIKAIAAADADERAFWARTIGQGKQDEGDLDRALSILKARGALDAARDDAIAWAERAKLALAAAPAHPLREELIDLADYVVSRIS